MLHRVTATGPVACGTPPCSCQFALRAAEASPSAPPVAGVIVSLHLMRVCIHLTQIRAIHFGYGKGKGHDARFGDGNGDVVFSAFAGFNRCL